MNQGNPSRRSRIRQESNASARGALIPPSPRHNRCARTRRFSSHATIVYSNVRYRAQIAISVVGRKRYCPAPTQPHRTAAPSMGACPEHRSHENQA